jgi:hypothetical protein
LYDIEILVSFEAVMEWDPDTTCKGSVKISEVNQDDDEIHMEVMMDYTGGFYT